MANTIWIVPPTGPAFARLTSQPGARQFQMRQLPMNLSLPAGNPLLLLGDLTAGPEKVSERLREVIDSQQIGYAPMLVLLIDESSLTYVPPLSELGQCILWHQEEPVSIFEERVRNAVTLGRERERTQRLQAVIPLYHVALSFADVTDLNELLQRILETALRETDADRGSIMLLDDEMETLYIAAAVGLPADVIEHHRQRVGEGIAGWVVQHRQPLILTEGEIPPFVLPWLRGRNAYSSVSVPMIHQGTSLGVLNLTKSPGNPPFLAGDVEFITILASQAATAIRNARLFRQTQAALDELRQLDRLRTQIIDIAAHELRTPVAVIKGYMELLEEMVDEDLLVYLEPVVRNVRRLESLVRDLFELSTLRALERTPHPRQVTIASWLFTLLEQYQEVAREKDIVVSGTTASTAAQGWFDPEHVAAILHHLLTNAIKFTPPKGKISVSVEREPDSTDLLFHVDDSGPGIPPEERQRIFRGFYQIEEVDTRQHEGLGIGLTLAQTLATAHNITIRVDDSPLGGARFTLAIPQPSHPQ